MTTTEMTAVVCRGVVTVYVPGVDCEGGQRSISFPRCCLGGNVLYGSPSYHWASKRYVKAARVVARKALREACKAC